MSQRNGNSYIGISSLTLATFSTPISCTFPQIFGKYETGTVSFTPTVGIPIHGTIKITYPNDYSMLGTDCEVSGLVLMTNYKCSISGSTATIQIFESFPAENTMTVSADLEALSDTGSSVFVNSFYDSLSSIPIETGSAIPIATVANPYWPKYLDYLPQTITTSTSIVSSYAIIKLKIKPGVSITNSGSSYLTVTMGTPFSGKNINAQIVCTINENKVPCYESVANTQFTIYASSLISISTSSWQELKIYTQNANLDNNGYIQPNTAQYNTITVVATDGTTIQTEKRTISIPNNQLLSLAITYLHTTAGQPNIFSFNFKAQYDTVGTSDVIVIEFPLKDYNNNLLFDYDLGSGKASGENFYMDNYTLQGSFSCILYYGDSTNNYPATIKITGYDSVTAGTSISFEIPKITNPQTSGYDINLSIRVYIISNGVITEERTVEYLFSPFSYSTSSSCSPTAPVFSSYLTSASSTVQFVCCASVDLIATDLVLIEVPAIYPFPSSPGVQSGSAFNYYKIYPSAKWILLKSSTTVNCQTGSPTSTLTNFINPAYEILANILTFKAYIITTKTPVGATNIYKPTVIDSYDFNSVPFAIDPSPPSSITSTISPLLLSDTTTGVQSILTATISYTGIIPNTGYFTITLNVQSDPYYFFIAQGITGEFSFSLSGMTYTVSNFGTISSSIIIKIPVINPAAGTFITVQFDAYDSNSYFLGTSSANSIPMVSLSYLTLPTQSHIFQYLSYSDTDSSASFRLSLNLPFAISSSTNYIKIEFDNGIDDSTFIVSGSDNTQIFDGTVCSVTCISTT